MDIVGPRVASSPAHFIYLNVFFKIVYSNIVYNIIKINLLNKYIYLNMYLIQ